MSLVGGKKPDDVSVSINGDALKTIGAGGGKGGEKLDFLFMDVTDPFFGSELLRFPRADSVVPNGNGGGAVELLYFDGVVSKPVTS